MVENGQYPFNVVNCYIFQTQYYEYLALLQLSVPNENASILWTKRFRKDPSGNLFRSFKVLSE